MSKTALFLFLCLIAACRHRSLQLSGPAVQTPEPFVLSVGTTLAFRTAQTIDLAISRPGQTFAVVVSRDAADATGQTILPSGSPATLVTRLVGSSALSEGAAGRLELALASVTLNGDSFLTSNFPTGGVVENASLGTFRGGVPGTEGWAAGPQKPMAMEPLRWPVGSLLTFRLTQPISLIGSHR